MMPRRVGILGGMGPEATVLLMSKVIAAVPAKDDRDHVPLIVDQNSQVPSRIKHLVESTGEDPGPVLAEMAKRLERSGAKALAMPCNTAHHYAVDIAASVRIPLLNMVTLSAARAQKLAGGSDCIGVLASPAVRRVGLFDAALCAAGLTAIYASDDDAMLDAIQRIKATGVNTQSRDTLHHASVSLLAEGAKVQMIACTEFSLIANDCVDAATTFDTLDVLVEAICEFSFSDSSKDDT